MTLTKKPKRVRFEERIGEKFGRLTILSVEPKPKKPGTPRYGECLCECGSIVNVGIAYVISGNTKSCGCFRRKHHNLAVMRAFSSYNSNAKVRGHPFHLNKDEFKTLIDGDCHYCGAEPFNTLHYKGDTYTSNGIDRVDNSKGYTIENSVSCCAICNQAKHTLPYETFIAWARRINKWQS